MECQCLVCSLERTYKDLGLRSEIQLERGESCLYYNKEEKTMSVYDLGDVKVSVTFDLDGQDLGEHCCHCERCFDENIDAPPSTDERFSMQSLMEHLHNVVTQEGATQGVGMQLDGVQEEYEEELITLELTPEEVARVAQLASLVEGDDACYSLGEKVAKYVDDEYMVELVDDVEASFSMSGGVVLKV